MDLDIALRDGENCSINDKDLYHEKNIFWDKIFIIHNSYDL